MEDIFDMNDSMESPLDELNPLVDINTDILSSPLDNGDNILGAHSNPFSSGFDEEHPMPSYEELLNAGFPKEAANYILYSPTHTFSQRELFHCLYESDNPFEAYKDLVNEKVDEFIDKCQADISHAREILMKPI